MKEIYYFQNNSYVLRNIHEQYFLNNITDNYSDDKCKILELDEIGCIIWEAIKEGMRIADVVQKILEMIEGDVEKVQVYKDVEECLEVLVLIGAAYKRYT